MDITVNKMYEGKLICDMKKSIEKKSMKKKSRLNLVLPLAITLVLMVLVVIYTSRLFYRISVSNIYEVGGDKISGLSASLGNYIDTTKSVVWVTADSVDFMIQSGESQEMVLDYLMEETVNHKMQFDENYTGLYGYIRGEYLDGLGWEPPEGYDPRERDWYRLAKLGGGDLVIVPPYIDAQTGSVVITVCKLLSDGESVLALDVITNHIQHVVDTTDINDKGYGFILDGQGIVIAHKDTSLNGKDLTTVDGGSELIKLYSSISIIMTTLLSNPLNLLAVAPLWSFFSFYHSYLFFWTLSAFQIISKKVSEKSAVSFYVFAVSFAYFS